MFDYESLTFLYPEKEKRIIFLFETFLEKITNSDLSSLKNKDLNSVRIVREFFLKADFDLVDNITTAHMVSGNYYQHQHNLFLTWRDMSRNYSDVARLLCMLFSGEINLLEDTTVSEVAKDVYINIGIGDMLHAKIEKVSIFPIIAEVWSILMGYDNNAIRNISLGCEQYTLPSMQPAKDIDDVVVFHSELSVADLGVGLADSILESWCDGENSLENLVLLTTQPLYSRAMKEDGLIGSFVAKQNMGKSLYSNILRTVYPKVGDFTHKALTDKGYLYMDLMSGIATEGKDFAIFQETDGMSLAALSALKPLVTYSDRVSARRFGGSTYEATYHGSIILTSNHLNDAAITGDLAKRIVNVKFKYSKLVESHARWLMSKEGALSVLVACLYRRSRMMKDGYKTAFDLKRDVSVNLADTVADLDNVLLLREYILDKGFLTGRELAGIFNNPRAGEITNITKNYGLERYRRSGGIAYRVDEKSDVFGTLVAAANVPTAEALTVTRYSLDQTVAVESVFDPKDVNSILLENADYSAWRQDPQEFKKSMLYIVSASNDSTIKREAMHFNRVIVDYDNFEPNVTFESLRDQLEILFGEYWFALWETPRSEYGKLRVRLMVLLHEELERPCWPDIVKQLDELVGATSDPTNAPEHKQGLALPWLKYHMNSSDYLWKPRVHHETVDTKPVKFQYAGVKTAPPENWDEFVEDFIYTVEDYDDKLDDYDFWMRTYLIPISRYIVYDKSITLEQGKRLIQLTTDSFGDKMKNVRLLIDAVKRGAGVELFETYNKSISEWFMPFDYSPDGFEF